MGGDDHEVPAVPELAQPPDDLLDLHVVEVSGRFVGEHYGRVEPERARDRDTLLLTAGQVARAMVVAVAQSHLVEQLLRASSGGARPHAGGAQR